jgi:hypothetical protein
MARCSRRSYDWHGHGYVLLNGNSDIHCGGYGLPINSNFYSHIKPRWINGYGCISHYSDRFIS